MPLTLHPSYRRALLAVGAVAGATAPLGAQQPAGVSHPPAARAFRPTPAAWAPDSIPVGSRCFALAYAPRTPADTVVDVLPTYLALWPAPAGSGPASRWVAARWRPRATPASDELFRPLRGTADVSRGGADTVVVALELPMGIAPRGRLALRPRRAGPWRGVASWSCPEACNGDACPVHGRGEHTVTATPVACAEGRWLTRR